MPWKTRAGRRYYYRNERRGSRVITKYIGCGAVAEVAARVDELKRAEQAARKLAVQQDHYRYTTVDQAVRDLCQLADQLTAAGLITAGLYKRHYQWRRRRARKHNEDAA